MQQTAKPVRMEEIKDEPASVKSSLFLKSVKPDSKMAGFKTYSRRKENHQAPFEHTKTEQVKIVITKSPIKKRKTKITDYFNKKLPDEYELAASCKQYSMSSPIKAGEKQQERQTFLDLGQKNLFMKTCNECGFSYDSSFKTDVKHHKTFHDNYFSCFHAEKFLWSDGAKDGDCIIKVDSPCIGYDLVNRVNGIMGALEQTKEEIRLMSLYLYIRKSAQVIGMMSIEMVERSRCFAFKSTQSIEIGADLLFGVSRIWVDQKHRRKGIAQTLLKSVKRCDHSHSILCNHDCQVKPDEVAFSQPTSEGIALATKYQNGAIVVYK